jgi:hypothetical protein
MPPRKQVPSLAHDLLVVADLYRTALTMMTRHLLSHRRWPDPGLTAGERTHLGVASPVREIATAALCQQQPRVISPSRPLSGFGYLRTQWAPKHEARAPTAEGASSAPTVNLS